MYLLTLRYSLTKIPTAAPSLIVPKYSQQLTGLSQIPRDRIRLHPDPNPARLDPTVITAVPSLDPTVIPAVTRAAVA